MDSLSRRSLRFLPKTEKQFQILLAAAEGFAKHISQKYEAKYPLLEYYWFEYVIGAYCHENPRYIQAVVATMHSIGHPAGPALTQISEIIGTEFDDTEGPNIGIASILHLHRFARPLDSVQCLDTLLYNKVLVDQPVLYGAAILACNADDFKVFAKKANDETKAVIAFIQTCWRRIKTLGPSVVYSSDRDSRLNHRDNDFERQTKSKVLTPSVVASAQPVVSKFYHQLSYIESLNSKGTLHLKSVNENFDKIKNDPYSCVILRTNNRPMIKNLKSFALANSIARDALECDVRRFKEFEGVTFVPKDILRMHHRTTAQSMLSFGYHPH